jgi:hypothetical protein
VIGNAHPSHSPSAANRTRAPSSSSVITQEPVTCGSNTIVPSRLLTTTLAKPAGPRCSAQVAWITLRLLLAGFVAGASVAPLVTVDESDRLAWRGCCGMATVPEMGYTGSPAR